MSDNEGKAIGWMVVFSFWGILLPLAILLWRLVTR